MSSVTLILVSSFLVSSVTTLAGDLNFLLEGELILVSSFLVSSVTSLLEGDL